MHRTDRGRTNRSERAGRRTSQSGPMSEKARPSAGASGRRAGEPGRRSGAHVSRSGGGGRQATEREKGSRRSSDRDRTETESTEAEEFTAGRRPVLEALRAGRPLNKLLIAEGAEGGSLAEIVAKAKDQGVLMQKVPRAHLTSIAGAGHQGVLAYVAAHAYAQLQDVIDNQTGQPPLVVLLDEVADPHNLGAVLRTAEAAGAQGVVIPKRRSVPLTGTVAKAAAGALEYLPVVRVANLTQAMEQLKKAGYWIVGTDADAKTEYTEVDCSGPVAIVIGSEGRGISRLVRERCDYLVRLPMRGRVSSLNASVAAGVLLYEVVRQRG